MRPRSAVAVWAVLVACSQAQAQTNDHFFRSWRWTEEPSSPRAAGLGGAMTGVGDDGAAALHNPAGLASVTKSEVAGGLMARGGGTNARGDTLVARTSVGFALAAVRLRQRWVLAGYVAETLASRIKLDAVPLADGFTDAGSLEGVATELGAAAAWQLSSRLQLGGRLAVSRLALDGEYSREPAAGPTNLRVTTSGSASRPTGAIGAVLLPAPWLRLAASVSEGVTWRVTRRATSPVQGVVLDDGSAYEVRQPRVFSLGATLQASRKLLFSAQLDRVAYHEIQSALIIGQGAHARGDYALSDAWEPRLGVELSLPRRAASVQLRAGVHWRAAGSLRYTGADRGEASAFSGSSRQVLGSVGGSLVTARWLRFDLSGRFGGDRGELLFGTAVRF
jgi:long-subunit fatty acid transport protein